MIEISKCVKINRANHLYLLLKKIGSYEEIDGNKYLTLIPTNERKEKTKKYKELWIKIRYLIWLITITDLSGAVVRWLSLLTTWLNETLTQVLCMFKLWSRRVRDSRWWGSLTMVPATNKAKSLLSVNHTTKIIHHQKIRWLWKMYKNQTRFRW